MHFHVSSPLICFSFLNEEKIILTRTNFLRSKSHTSHKTARDELHPVAVLDVLK
jgi:hypothetical protein